MTESARPETRRQKSRRIVRKHYHERGWLSPYTRYGTAVAELLGPGASVLDVGCGRSFPMAEQFLSTGAEVFGLDPVAEPEAASEGAKLLRGTADDMPFEGGRFDVVTSCAVLEHFERPVGIFEEFQRVLKPGGRVVFLTAGKYDYVSMLSRLIPNFLHGRIVKATEGRDEADTFPTFYRANSIRAIARIARRGGLEVERLEYQNQFPYALAFSPLLVRIGIAYDRLIQRARWLHWLQGWLFGMLRKPGGEGEGGGQ